MSVNAATTGAGSDRSPAIYGIRGLAALALLTVHVAMFSGLLGTRAFGTPRPPSNFLGGFLVSGLPSFIGVFFVLPALFLYLPLARSIIAGSGHPPAGTGLAHRLLRLLPGYYAMYLVVLLALNRDAIDGIWYVLRPVLLLQIYSPTPFRPNFINGMEITWTVPTMVQWYLVLPLIALATHRYAARGATPAARARRLMLPVPILVALGVGWLFLVKANGWDNRMVFWWPQGFAPSIAVGMALAIMLALARVSPADTPRLLRFAADRPGVLWLGASVVYLVNCARPFSVIGMDAIYSTSGLLVTYVMVAMFGLLSVLALTAPGARPHPVSSALRVAPLAYLGKVSYGIYLWHFAVMHFYLQFGNIVAGHPRPIRELYGTSGFWELELVTVAGSVLLATLSYRLVEQPVATWGERLLRARAARRATASSTDSASRPAVPGLAGPPDPDGPRALTVRQAAAAVAAATAQRDAISANLLDLDRSFGTRLLAGANLTGETKARWDAASVELAALWELSAAYQAVVDAAAAALALSMGSTRTPPGAQQRRDGTQRQHGEGSVQADPLIYIEDLLTSESVVVAGARAPLGRREITDSGQTRLTMAAAVTRMNVLFASTAALVTTVEQVYREVTDELDRLAGELDRADEPAGGVAGANPALADARAQLDQVRHRVSTDPLALWVHQRVHGAELDRLRRLVAAVVPR